MSNLNSVQKSYLKTIESKEKREQLKKLFIMANKEKEVKDAKKLLKKLLEKANQN